MFPAFLFCLCDVCVWVVVVGVASCLVCCVVLFVLGLSFSLLFCVLLLMVCLRCLVFALMDFNDLHL